MFRRAREGLERLLRSQIRFAPPAVPPDEGDALPAIGAALRAWIARAPERYARCFLRERPLLVSRRERPLFRQLAALGLAQRMGPSIYVPCVRLFQLYGRLIATDRAHYDRPDQVFALMFEQVYLVRNMDIRPADRVLELCLGSGVNSLFAADVARSVTGVDVNPRALAFARFNEALNPAPRPLACHEGSLFEPVASEPPFDTIVVNPPFELVPREETWFLHSDGGEDGLDVVRRILADAPVHLAPEGRFQIITWSPATPQGPVLLDLLREAFSARRLTVHTLDVQPLERHVEAFARSPHYGAWRERLRARDVHEVHFLFVHAAPGATPGVEEVTPRAEIEACDEIADAWLRT